MPETNRRSAMWVSSGAFTVVVGLIFITAGAEGLVVFNACIADPGCLRDASAMNVEAFFAILAVEIALAVAGASVLLTQQQVSRTIPP